MKNRKTFIILLLALIIFTISIIHKGMQNDVFFTIKTGEYILKNGINDIEPFTFHNNLKFTKLRWGFDILIYLIYSLSGFKGIYIFVIIFSAIISFSLYYSLVKNKSNNITAFLISLFIIKNLSYFLTARAQIISYLIFILEIYSLYKLSETNNKKYSIYLIILSFLILTFHSSVWLAYIVFFLPFIAEIIINKLNFKFLNNIFDIRKYDKIILITFIIVIFTGFLTPLKLSPFTFMPKVITSYSKVIISELQPLSKKKTIIFAACIFIPVLISIFKRIKLRLCDILFLTGCFIMSIMAERNFYIALFVIAIPISNILNNIFIEFKINKLLDKIDKKLIINIPVVLLTLYFSFCNYKKIVNEEYVSKSSYPVNAVKYINTNIDTNKMRIFNDFNNGSYLEFKNIKAFIDSRSEIYCEEFNDTKILKDFDIFNQKNENYIYELISKYNLTHILINRNAYYRSFLYYNDDFNLIYQDEYYYLFEVKNKK